MKRTASRIGSAGAHLPPLCHFAQTNRANCGGSHAHLFALRATSLRLHSNTALEIPPNLIRPTGHDFHCVCYNDDFQCDYQKGKRNSLVRSLAHNCSSQQTAVSTIRLDLAERSHTQWLPLASLGASVEASKLPNTRLDRLYLRFSRDLSLELANFLCVSMSHCSAGQSHVHECFARLALAIRVGAT